MSTNVKGEFTHTPSYIRGIPHPQPQVVYHTVGIGNRPHRTAIWLWFATMFVLSHRYCVDAIRHNLCVYFQLQTLTHPCQSRGDNQLHETGWLHTMPRHQLL